MSAVIFQRRESTYWRIASGPNFLITLIVLSGSIFFASFSLGQSHDHSATSTGDATEPQVEHAAAGENEHAQHANVADPHAGHAMDTNAHEDAANSHAQHGEATSHDDHSQHTPAPDPHAGHVMETIDLAEPADHNHDDMAISMDMGNGRMTEPKLRDPHAYSNGLKVGEGPYALENDRLYLMDGLRFGGLRMNRMEQLFIDGSDAFEYDSQAWYGTSYDRLVLKAEGELRDGSLEESNTELLWTHAVRSFWNTQIGVLHRTGDGPSRNWLALGLQGIAPYWFEIDATLYLGQSGRTAFNLEAEYDLWLTQHLILQPRMEMNFHGKNDQATATGSGLSDLSTGIRFQYQINRQLIPYVGVEQFRQYGQTARYSGVSSGDSETRWLAGLRFWF